MIEELLDSQYVALEKATDDYTKAHLLYTIIQIKISEDNVSTVNNNLYPEIKRFITLYLSGVEFLEYGFDMINYKSYVDCIESQNEQEQFMLYEYLERKLTAYGHTELADRALNDKIRLKSILLLKKMNYINWPRKLLSILFLYSSVSFRNLFITTFLFFVTLCFIVLPAPFPSWGIFEIRRETISDNYFLNLILTTLAGLLQLDGGVVVIPKTPWALLLQILGKILVLMIIGNFLLQEFFRKMKYNL